MQTQYTHSGFQLQLKFLSEGQKSIQFQIQFLGLYVKLNTNIFISIYTNKKSGHTVLFMEF